MCHAPLVMRALFLFIVTFHTFSSTLFAQNFPLPVTLSGIVVDETGRPQTNVTIDDLCRPIRHHALTGPDGRFTLESTYRQPLRLHIVAVSADGLLQSFYQTTRDGPVPDPAALHIVLKSARQFPVTVVDEKSNPIGGVEILADAMYETIGLTHTNAAGKATLRLPADLDLTSVAAMKNGAGFDYFLFWRQLEIHSDPYHLDPSYTGPLAFTLNGALKKKIHAVDAKARPVAGAAFVAYRIEKPKKGGALNAIYQSESDHPTDENGMTELGWFPADAVRPFQLDLLTPGYGPAEMMTINPAVSSPDMTVTLLKSIHISGTVVSEDGKPVASAMIMSRGASFSWQDFPSNEVSAADGTFAFDTKADQYFSIQAIKDHLVSTPTSFVIHRDDPAPLRIKLQPGKHVFGQFTSGEKRTPTAADHIELVLIDETGYDKLPAADKLPVPKEAIPPYRLVIFLAQVTKTDADGKYEFYTSRGKGYIAIYGGSNANRRFEIIAEDNNQIDLHTDVVARVTPPLNGIVIKDDGSDKGIAEVNLTGVSDDFRSRAGDGVSDKAGKFYVNRGAGALYLYAVSFRSKMGRSNGDSYR